MFPVRSGVGNGKVMFYAVLIVLAPSKFASAKEVKLSSLTNVTHLSRENVGSGDRRRDTVETRREEKCSEEERSVRSAESRLSVIPGERGKLASGWGETLGCQFALCCGAALYSFRRCSFRIPTSLSAVLTKFPVVLLTYCGQMLEYWSTLKKASMSPLKLLITRRLSSSYPSHNDKECM